MSVEENSKLRHDTPPSVTAAALVEFCGSALALLVSALFLLSEIARVGFAWQFPRTDRYQGSKKLARVWGPGSAYHFLNPAFYLVYIIFPISVGLLGIVCAFGLPELRAWARKGTLFLARAPVLICLLLVLFRPSTVFPPDPDKEALLAFGGAIYWAIFVCLLAVLIPISIWWQILFTRQRVAAIFR